MFYFLGGALSRESDDRPEARRVSKQGIDPTQSDYQDEEEVQGLGPNSQTSLSA